MSPKEFNNKYDLTYANYEEMPLVIMEGRNDGYWMNYAKGAQFIQVVVTKKDDEDYRVTYKGEKVKEIYEEIVKDYEIEV